MATREYFTLTEMETEASGEDFREIRSLIMNKLTLKILKCLNSIFILVT